MFPWSKELVEDYIIYVYATMNKIRPTAPGECRPSSDLEVLEEFWCRYFKNSVCFVTCLELTQFELYLQLRKLLLEDLEKLKLAKNNNKK